ncbi:hypothetical protein IQ259_07330 [Fortiea sp. LEGE XX443]|uniref:hypothetical protein n=1 Tax=Fortiea sp. LEGE XX443 TaxID=1828611 RepID=UPI0018813CC9|nr:hypothetical protein [Fortiea sp. LEGE XX443]MBE9004850.1 hypothetical protein [Fortiea sp. LEGE XX443]
MYNIVIIYTASEFQFLPFNLCHYRLLTHKERSPTVLSVVSQKHVTKPLDATKLIFLIADLMVG